MSCERKMTHLLLLLGRDGVGQVDSWSGCQKTLDATPGMCGIALALWSRWRGRGRGTNAWFFSAGDINLGPDAQEGQSLVPIASPTFLPPSLPLGCGAVDSGRWPHQTFHPTSCFWSLWDVNHKLKFCFPVFFPEAQLLLAWHCMGERHEISGLAAGLWAGSAQLPPPLTRCLTPSGTPNWSCLCPPICSGSLTPSCNGWDLAAANRTDSSSRTEPVRISVHPHPGAGRAPCLNTSLV